MQDFCLILTVIYIVCQINYKYFYSVTHIYYNYNYQYVLHQQLQDKPLSVYLQGHSYVLTMKRVGFPTPVIAAIGRSLSSAIGSQTYEWNSVNKNPRKEIIRNQSAGSAWIDRQASSPAKSAISIIDCQSIPGCPETSWRCYCNLQSTAIGTFSNMKNEWYFFLRHVHIQQYI